MKIALLAPAWFAVPPVRYGGIEWVVSILADGLVDRGHDVTLFAAGESRTKAHLVTSYDESAVLPHRHVAARSAPRAHVPRARRVSSTSSTTTPARSPARSARPSTSPFCHTVHGPLTGEPGLVYAQIKAIAPDVRLISLSEDQRSPRPELNWLATCHNAIDIDAYPYSARPRRLPAVPRPDVARQGRAQRGRDRRARRACR